MNNRRLWGVIIGVGAIVLIVLSLTFLAQQISTSLAPVPAEIEEREGDDEMDMEENEMGEENEDGETDAEDEDGETDAEDEDAAE